MTDTRRIFERIRKLDRLYLEAHDYSLPVARLRRAQKAYRRMVKGYPRFMRSLKSMSVKESRP